MTQAEYDAYAEKIASGQVVTIEGRTAASAADLDFALKAAGHEIDGAPMAPEAEEDVAENGAGANGDETAH